MSYETEKALLSIYRIEVIKKRLPENPEQITVLPFDNEAAAKHNFEGLALKECKYMLLLGNWTKYHSEVYTTYNLYVRDKLTETITIKAGGIQ